MLTWKIVFDTEEEEPSKILRFLRRLFQQVEKKTASAKRTTSKKAAAKKTATAARRAGTKEAAAPGQYEVRETDTTSTMQRCKHVAKF